MFSSNSENFGAKDNTYQGQGRLVHGRHSKKKKCYRSWCSWCWTIYIVICSRYPQQISPFPPPSLVVGQVVGDALRGGLHGLLTRPPPSRAHLPMLVGELEGLHQPERLVHVSAHRQVVHRHLAQGALAVDDEQAAEGDPVVFLQESRLKSRMNAV